MATLKSLKGKKVITLYKVTGILDDTDPTFSGDDYCYVTSKKAAEKIKEREDKKENCSAHIKEVECYIDSEGQVVEIKIEFFTEGRGVLEKSEEDKFYFEYY